MEQIVQRVHGTVCILCFSILIIWVRCRSTCSGFSRKLENVDILVHVSIADLRRNVDLYTDKQFDTFAPGWSDAIDYEHKQDGIAIRRPQLLVRQVAALGLTKAKHSEEIRGPDNQPLYWLSLFSRDKLAHKLWAAVSSAAKQSEMLMDGICSSAP